MTNEFKKDRPLFKEKDPRKNASGCNDPTAYQAMKNIDEEEEEFKKKTKLDISKDSLKQNVKDR